jgi:hypothetical protein
MRIAGIWWPADRVAGPLRPVPFEVPNGTAAITVTLEYDRSGGAVLDLGCAGPEGFRGWSGGARETFTVGIEQATPGYLPGPIVAGLWEVWLGLHRVPPEGLRYSLEIETHTRIPSGGYEDVGVSWDGPAERPPPRDLPTVDGLRWYAGDLHAHTTHSDGALTVDGLALLAAQTGLDFLAVTDHNTISHYPFLAKASARSGVVLIPGQEVTTELGHANVWGSAAWIDFRKPATSWLTAAEKAGALFSVNHPLAGDCAWRHPLKTQPAVAELWHWSWWDRTWGEPLAWARRHPAGVIPVGGSDFHRVGGTPASLGEPVTWVLAEDRSASAILDGIRRGRTAISATRTAPLLLRCGSELVALGADGLALVRPDESRVLIHGDRKALPGDFAGMYRLETWRNEVMALCG